MRMKQTLLRKRLEKIAELFFATVAVAAHELVYATSCVDEFLFAGEEGVRRAGDFELNQRIGDAINFDCFFGSYGRAGNKDFLVRHIFEDYFTIV